MKNLGLCFVAFFWLTVVISAQAEVLILADDFEDGVLNTLLWSHTDGVVVEAGGTLTLNKGTGYQGSVKSLSTFSITAEEAAILTSSDIYVKEYSTLGTWGFTEGNFFNSVMVRAQQFGGGSNMVNILIAKNGVYQYLPIQTTNLWLYGWTLIWSADRVVVESEVWGRLFDSDVQTTDAVGNPWNIPGPEAKMQVWIASPAYNATFQMILEDIQLEIKDKDQYFGMFDKIDDDFDGATLNSRYWTDLSAAPGNITVQDGKAIFDCVWLEDPCNPGSTLRYAAYMRANSGYWTHPAPGEALVFIAEDVVEGTVTKNFYMDFYNGGSYPGGTAVSMGLHTGIEPEFGRLYFAINDQPAGFYDYFELTNYWGFSGTWKMLWEADRVRVYTQDGSAFVQIFDTDTNTGVNGALPGQWHIPDVDLGLYVTNSWDSVTPPSIGRIYVGPPQCGELGYPAYDVNSDCFVDVLDMQALAANWLVSTDPLNPAHQDFSDPMTVEVPQTTATVTLDGSMTPGEWDEAAAYVLDTSGIEPNDFAVTAYFMHDANSLYLGFDVKDDIVEFTTYEHVYENDSVSVYFDFDNSDTYNYIYDPGDPDLGVQLIALCVAEPDTYPGDNFSNPAGADWWSAYGPFSYNLPGDGYFLEFRIDLNASPLEMGTLFGFDFSVTDYDAFGVQSHYADYNNATWNDESHWADIVLLPKTQCGAYGFAGEDFNRDCVVNLADYAQLAGQWLACTDPDVEKCPAPLDCQTNPQLCQ